METLLSYIRGISSISQETEEAIKHLFERKELGKNEVFLPAGKVARRLEFIEKGISRAYYVNDKGAEYNKHFFIGPCFTGGYASLISGQANQIVQETMSKCTMWTTDYQKFQALYPRFHDLETVARKIAESIFVQKEQREVELVTLNANERYKLFQKQYPQLEQLIPQYHIASYLGVTPTQLSRIRAAKA